MKTGLFGGTFNPVHLGHIQIARTVQKAFALDELIVVPAAQPPHKQAGDMADPLLRLEMARLAFEPVPGCRVSDIELRRSGPSYTIDTVSYFFSHLPAEAACLYLIIGLDAFLELPTWKDYGSLLKQTPFIVVHRPGAAGTKPLQTLADFLNDSISPDFRFSQKESCFYHILFQPVYYFDQIDVRISATEIRRRIRSGQPVKNLLPEAVENVIHQNNLYL